MAGTESRSAGTPIAPGGEVRLVGRERQRALLERWLDTSLAGSPRVVALTGAAGIGKTRLMDWLASRAAQRGAQVHAGSGLAGTSAPYIPIRTAFAQVSDRVIDELVAPGDVDPALVRSGTISASGLVRAAEAIVDATQRRPRVILFDDLQWFDQPSLDLISRITTLVSHRATAAPVPAMLVLASRTGDPRDPHERLGVQLTREPNARHLELAPLDHLELMSFIEAIGGAPPTPELTQLLAEAADGNPLETELGLRRLLADGTVSNEGGRLCTTSSTPLRLRPVDVDEELARRLDTVSDEARDLLTVAAALGDGSDLDDLAVASGTGADEVDELLDELDEAGLVHADDVRFSFTRSQLRQVALARLGRRKRRALHLTIADRLAAAHPLAEDDHALALAHHLRLGQAPPERLVDVAVLAGRRADRLELWGRAAQFYEMALDADAAAAASHPDRAGWALSAGLAHNKALDLPRAEARLKEAIDAAGDDLATRGNAALVLTRCRLTQGLRPGQMVDLRELGEFLDAAEESGREPGLRALALGLLAESHFSAFDLERGFGFSRRARELSAEVGDDAVACMVEAAEGIQHLGALNLDDAATCFDRSVAHGLRSDPGLPLGGLARRALVHWLRGEFADATELLERSLEITEARHQWGEQSFALACSVGIAALHGDSRETEHLGEQARRLCRVAEYPYAAAQLYPALAWNRAVRGDLAGAHEAIDEWRGGVGLGGATFRPLLAALAGEHAEPVVPAGWPEHPDRAPTLLDLSLLVVRIELGDLLDDPTLTESTLGPVESLVERGVVFALDRGSFLPRLAGVAALRAGLLDQADDALQRAEALLTTRVESPGELARTRFDRARVLVERDGRGDRREATSLLASAHEGFDALGWLPFLERVARLRETLPAEAADAVGPASAVRYILFTDIADSTRLNVELGDVRYVEVLTEHDRFVRARLRHHNGVEFKHTGDGICAAFPTADDAVAAAVGIQRDLDEWRELDPARGVRVRCGLAAGRPIEVGGDLFGSSVALAARVCDLADADEVLLAGEVFAALGDEPAARCDARGDAALKGFPDPVPIYRSPVPL